MRRPLKWIPVWAALSLAGLAAGCGDGDDGDGKGESKAERNAKEGALKEKSDPAEDLKLQKANLERLERNARENREAGNIAGAWAAEMDARHVRELIEKDRELLRNRR